MVVKTSIREQLDAEIALYQGEVDRLALVANVEYPAAVAKLDALKKLAADVTPQFEDVADRLKQGGIDVPINKPAEAEPVKPSKERGMSAREVMNLVTEGLAPIDPVFEKERPMQISTQMPALVAPKAKAKPKGKKR